MRRTLAKTWVRHVDLYRVSIFARVVEERGFTAAAKALGLPKSSVSRHVTLLEQEIGARLLRRSTRGISLTEAGEVFYTKASHGLAVLAEASEDVHALESEIRGRVRLTAPPDLGTWLLAPIVAAFVELHPAVMVEVELTVRVVDLVGERFDLALRAQGVDDLSLVARKLRPIDIALFAAPSYLARHGRPEHPSQLAEHRCVLFRAPEGRATWKLLGPKGVTSVSVSGSLESDDFPFALEGIAEGAGIGLLPCFLAERAGRGRIERVLPDHVASAADLHLVHAAGRYLPRRVALLRDRIVEALGASPPPTAERKARRPRPERRRRT